MAVEAVVLRARAGLGVAASLTAIHALGGARKSAKTEAALVTGDPTQMSLSRALPLMQRSLRMASLQLRLWRLLAKQKQPQRLSPEEPVLTFDEVEKHRQAKRSGDLFVTQKEDTTKLLAQLKGAHKVDHNELDEEDTFLSGKKHGGSTATKAVDSEEKETKGECLAN